MPGPSSMRKVCGGVILRSELEQAAAMESNEEVSGYREDSARGYLTIKELPHVHP